MSFSAEYVDPPFKDDEFLGWSKKAFASDEHVVLSEYLLIFTIVLVGSLILQYYVGHVQKLCKDIPEAAATLLLGMVVGLVIKICSSSEPSSSLTVVDDGHSASGGEGHVTSFDVRLLGFSPQIFFFGFLPPIIFNSGYHLKRKLFFSNFGAIFSLAILGTCFSLLLFAAGLYFLCYWGFVEDVKSFSFVELIAFGALISSTDPVSMLACFSSLKVDPMLFYLVFGESVLNDAIAITVFKVASKYVGYRMTQLDILYCILQIFVCFFLSSFLGYLMGILTAFLFKFIMIRNNAIVSVSIFIATVYIPYFLSETLQLSGIVTIFFSGISARRYTSKNISHESRCYASFLFQMLTNLADTACFMLLGMSVFSQSYSSFGISISVFSTLLCYLSRACHVYPLLSMVNLIRHWKNEISNTEDQSEKPRSTPHQIISTNTMHMVFMSGLRGAVAFSLAQIFPDTNGNRHIVLSTTTVIILFSVFVSGSLTSTLVRMLKIPTNVNPNEYLRELESKSPNDVVLDFEKKYIYPHILKNTDVLNSLRNLGQLRSPVMSEDMNWDESSGGGSYFVEDETFDDFLISSESPHMKSRDHEVGTGCQNDEAALGCDIDLENFYGSQRKPVIESAEDFVNNPISNLHLNRGSSQNPPQNQSDNDLSNLWVSGR